MARRLMAQSSRRFSLVLLSGLFALAGCAGIGAVTDRLYDPPVAAKYKPNKKDTMLVLVESYGLTLDSNVETEHLTQSLRKAMEERKVAPLVDADALEKLKDADPNAFAPMTIAEIGRKVGAGQVLYVNVWRAELVKPFGSGQIRGHMEAMVKIVDASTGDIRWPSAASSDTVQITTNWFPDTDMSDTQVRATMADQMAEDIGRLFHDYHPAMEEKHAADEENRTTIE